MVFLIQLLIELKVALILVCTFWLGGGRPQQSFKVCLWSSVVEAFSVVF